MKPFMRPLDDTLQLIGRARTGVYMPVYAPPASGENPYEVEIALVDDLAPATSSCWRATARPSASPRGESCSRLRAWRAARPDA